MEFKGTKGSGEFHFDEKGNFKKLLHCVIRFKCKRTNRNGLVVATQIEERNGIKIPVECEASWKLEVNKYGLG